MAIHKKITRIEHTVATTEKRAFALNLRRYMALHNKNQADMSRALDVSPTTFADWYHARKYPRPDMMQRIADYFDVPMSALRSYQRVARVGTSKSDSQQIAKSVILVGPKKPQVFDVYSQLNAEGRKKVLEYAKDLSESGKYGLITVSAGPDDE